MCLNETQLLTPSTVFWRAEPAEGYNHLTNIQGPKGVNEYQWILDGSAYSLDWKPGRYKIIVDIGSNTLELGEQEIGWRTDEYVIIGQIKQSDQVNLPINQQKSVKRTLYWDIIEVLEDKTNFPIIGESVPQVFEDSFMDLSGYLAFGAWSFAQAKINGNPEKGPLNSRTQEWFNSGEVDLNSTRAQRIWLMQELFNKSYDELNLSDTYPYQGNALYQVEKNRDYRMYSQFQCQFLVNNSKKMYDFREFSNKSRAGLTKVINQGVAVLPAGSVIMVFPTPYGLPDPIYSWPSSDIDLRTILAEDPEVSNYDYSRTGFNGGNGNSAVSLYSSSRVGIDGQNANWALEGLDVPWIFAEIIHEIRPDGSVLTEIESSVDKIFDYDGTSVSGDNVFNEITIFKLEREDPLDFNNKKILYRKKAVHKMDGQLNGFIDSGSNTRPTPFTLPRVQ